MIKFKVDTGASVTALFASMMDLSTEVTTTSKTLRGAGNHRLQLTGKAEVELGFRGRSIVDTVYFVEGLVCPLVGKPAISGLDMVEFVSELVDSNDYVSQYVMVCHSINSYHFMSRGN